MMVARILCFVFMMLGEIVWIICIDQMLEAKSNQFSKKFRILIWIMVGVHQALMQIFLNGHSSIQFVKNITIFIENFIVARCFYKDPIWRIIVAEMILLFSAALGEMVVFIAPLFVDAKRLFLFDYSMFEMAFAVGLGNILDIIAYSMVMYCWKKHYHSGEIGFYKVFFVLYCAFQMCIVFLYEYHALNQMINSVVKNILISSFFCNFVALIIVLRQTEKKCIRNTIN